jgi:3-methyladenine DNA glycosylase/8-oxoguanine DNA glycosylase
LVRTVLGQQVSIAAAAGLTSRIVAEFGESVPGEPGSGTDLRTFPTAERMAGVELSGMPRRRAALVAGVAAMVAERGIDDAGLSAALAALPGVGPWTRDYWALRVFDDPDAWPGTDLVLARAAAGLDHDRWRPWRGYASQHLWTRAAEEHL